MTGVSIPKGSKVFNRTCNTSCLDGRVNLRDGYDLPASCRVSCDVSHSKSNTFTTVSLSATVYFYVTALRFGLFDTQLLQPKLALDITDLASL